MIFITGSTGLIGIEIAKSLALKGERLKLLVRPTSDTTEIDKLQGDITIVEGN